jgi:hypothetical protein
LLSVSEELVVSATDWVCEPEDVQDSDTDVEWLSELALPWLFVSPTDWELPWLCPMALDWVNDSLAVSECMVESDTPLLEVMPSEDPQPAFAPTFADNPTPAGAMLPPTEPVTP